MSRFFVIITIFVSMASSAMAQSGLAIEPVIKGEYSSDAKVTATYMTAPNKYLRNHKLTVFASFKGPAAVYAKDLERMVLADGASAVGKNVRYKKGKLYFAFYMLRPVVHGKEKLNRYLYYLNSSAGSGSDILLVYLEGKAGEQDVTELIKSMAKNAR